MRATAALTVLALLPVTSLGLSAMAHASAVPHVAIPTDAGSGPLHGTSGLDAPTVDALMRAWRSGLFACFGWDGATATGSFVQFSFDPAMGTVSSVAAWGDTEPLPIVETIEISPVRGFTTPTVTGPLFTTTGGSMTILAHDAPAGPLEFHTGTTPGTVTFHLISSATSIMEQTASATWPESSVSFSVRESRARIVAGSGTLNVTGMTVVANMTANDMLVLRIVPGSLMDRAQPAAVLDALGSGRLAAEYSLVSTSTGGWIEDSVRYLRNLIAGPTSVAAGHATVWLGATPRMGGLLLLAFDPLTMPVDPDHRLAVTVNGTAVSESADVLAAFYASPGGADVPFYARLQANATVLAVYLPMLHEVTVDVASVPIADPGAERTAQAAFVAALGVVSVAAAVMFRRRKD